jgi:type II secretory pathway pseudopilin PulG
MTRQQGISLLELLISSFLASLLLAVVMQHYLASKRQSMHVQALLEQAFELQLLNDLIRDSLRRGGFTPCIGINFLQSIDRRSGKANLRAIETKAGKHQALRINRMSEHFTRITAQLGPSQILVTAINPYKAKQTILIADCYHAEVQQILRAQKTNAGIILTLEQPLAFNYIAPVYLGEWIEEEFFVQKDSQGHFALFYQLDHAEELSALVNKMIVNLTSSQGKTLVQIIWGLEKSQSMLIETEVRAP